MSILKENMKNNLPKKGFTLVEILLVVAIIGVLSTLVLINVGGYTKKARDSQRLSDMRQIQNALEQYYTFNFSYPGPVSSWGEGTTCGGWDTSQNDDDNDGRSWLEPLIDKAFMKTVPKDPTALSGGSCGGYRYYRYTAGSYGCSASRGDFFVLGVIDMESSNRPHPQSPGWSCPSRNWQNEMDWVVGGFTK